MRPVTVVHVCLILVLLIGNSANPIEVDCFYEADRNKIREDEMKMQDR